MNVYVDAFSQRASAEALDRFTDAVIAYLDRWLIVLGKANFVSDSASSGNRPLIEHLNDASPKELAEAQV